jgi:Uma2 family endonuclease
MVSAAWNLWEDDPNDPTEYPIEDEMGEDAIQRDITELLRPLLVRYLADKGVKAYVGADQFIYWVKGNPTAVVSPDVYVMPGLPQTVRPRCWKVWLANVVPSFALEVMAWDKKRKDVTESPERYGELGTQELVIFDPYAFERRRVGPRFRVHRRNAQGKLALVEETNADRVHSEALGCFVRAVGETVDLRLRIGTGPKGDELFPTDAELAKAERVRATTARLRGKLERAARLEAEAEVAKLRAELERLRKQSR